MLIEWDLVNETVRIPTQSGGYSHVVLAYVRGASKQGLLAIVELPHILDADELYYARSIYHVSEDKKLASLVDSSWCIADGASNLPSFNGMAIRQLLLLLLHELVE
jgi:hypothetical protein